MSAMVSSGNGITSLTGTIGLLDSTNVTNINTVAGMTTGVLTATVTSGAASVLKGLTTKSTDAITMTVNAESSGATAAADLVSLNGNTNQIITMTAVSSVSGSYSDLYDIYVTNKAQYNGIGDETVTITGTVSATQADAIADATSGIVTASISADTAANLNAALNDSGSQVNAYTFTVNNDSSATLASDLKALDSKTTQTITATSVTSISGNITDLKAVLGSSEITRSASLNVTINDATAASIADLITINNATPGTLTLNAATNSANQADTTANIMTAFNGITSLTGTIGLLDSTNVIRRVCEAALTFKYPQVRQIRGLLDKTTFDKEKADRIYDFLNKYSHLDRIESVENLLENKFEEGKIVVADFLELLNSELHEHYTNMCKTVEI